MKQFVKSIIPDNLQDMVRSSRPYRRIQTRRLAAKSKRLDICAAQFAHALHTSNHPSIAGKVCVELGSGWILSHAVVCHLLGAERVIATDILPHAYPESLHVAINQSNISLIRDILSPFEEHSLIRSRLDNLLSIPHFGFDVLRDLGIEYRAPIDFAQERLNIPVDFIYSNSVLEHVPHDDVADLLRNCVRDLNPDGTMMHCIHLEDHNDIQGEPFKFLSISSEEYSRTLQSARGNRISRNLWRELFTALPGTRSEFFYEWVRTDKEVPTHIDQWIRYNDVADLQVSHIGVYTRKVD